ncbi:MAG: GNAT family N-acetyltransferase [Bacillus sp. (in: firmicutes)]
MKPIVSVFLYGKKTDLELAKSLWGDSTVTKLISANGSFNENEIKERWSKEMIGQKIDNVQYWPIFELQTNEHIGCCGLRPYDLDKKIFEIGIHLKSLYWGKGYASEAVEAVINYAFDELKATNLFAGHHPDNNGSKHLLTKLGFKYSHNEYYSPTGLYHPSYFYH